MSLPTVPITQLKEEVKEEVEPVQLKSETGLYVTNASPAPGAALGAPNNTGSGSSASALPFKISTSGENKITEPESTSQPIQFKFQNDDISTVDKKNIKAFKPIQTKSENKTGMPDNLKSGIENMSGISMDDVKVHYNSDKPAQLQAYAYAQGTDIHIAGGQEKHLPHEAWHVVQQAQGRVKPTMQLKEDIPVNDDKGLEYEADVMGAKALQPKNENSILNQNNISQLKRIAVNKIRGNTIAQLVIDTTTAGADLEQSTKKDGSFIMINKNHVGAAPNNNIGFANVLDAAGWADLANSPENYWRAHAYAEQFGGGGDEKNIGWWPENIENNWTDWEHKVAGHTGLNQVDGRKPGDGEKGTLTVNRVLKAPALDFINGFLPNLQNAADWGLAENRPAFLRATATATGNKKQNIWRRTQMIKARTGAVAAIPAQLNGWLQKLFGKAGTQVIDNMTMTYAITNVGANPGPDRAAGMPHTENAPAPNVDDFSLKNEPANLWKQMVNQNVGVFAKADLTGIMNGLSERIPYFEGGPPDAAPELRAYQDGFGLPQP